MKDLIISALLVYSFWPGHYEHGAFHGAEHSPAATVLYAAGASTICSLSINLVAVLVGDLLPADSFVVKLHWRVIFLLFLAMAPLTLFIKSQHLAKQIHLDPALDVTYDGPFVDDFIWNGQLVAGYLPYFLINFIALPIVLLRRGVLPMFTVTVA